MNEIDTSQKRSGGFAAAETIIILFVLVILGVTGYLLFHGENQTHKNTSSNNTAPSSAPSNKNTGSYATLSPATVPSKTAECQQQVSFSSDGNSGPIQCASGDLNVLEWNSLAALEPKIMTLGYGATPAQVQNALCADVRSNVSNSIELTNYQISALYYGWHFSASPSAVITNGTCVNTDD